MSQQSHVDHDICCDSRSSPKYESITQTLCPILMIMSCKIRNYTNFLRRLRFWSTFRGESKEKMTRILFGMFYTVNQFLSATYIFMRLKIRHGINLV